LKKRVACPVTMGREEKERGDRSKKRATHSGKEKQKKRGGGRERSILRRGDTGGGAVRFKAGIE